MSQFELAHLRFDAKRMPALKQDTTAASAVHEEPTKKKKKKKKKKNVCCTRRPTLRRAGLTEHIRSSLASGHAWRAFVVRAAQRLHLAPCTPSPAPDDGAPRGPPTTAASNAERTLRARNADAQRSLASVRVGRSTASQLPTRRSARVSARQHTLPANLDMFALVFQARSDKCPPRALHCEFEVTIALPLVALRSGHLLDDHASPCHSSEHPRASTSAPRARPGRAAAALATAGPARRYDAISPALCCAACSGRVALGGLYQRRGSTPAHAYVGGTCGDAGSGSMLSVCSSLCCSN